MIKTFFILSLIHNHCKDVKWLSILMKKYTFSLSQQSCRRRRENYRRETNNIQIINLNIKEKKEFKLRGSASLRSNFQLFSFLLKTKQYVCRNVCENFRQIGRKMKKL